MFGNNPIYGITQGLIEVHVSIRRSIYTWICTAQSSLSIEIFKSSGGNVSFMPINAPL